MPPTPFCLPRARTLGAAFGIAALLLAAPSGSAAPDEPPVKDARPLGERVNEAIERGVAWLLAHATRATVANTPIAHWGLIGGRTNYLGGTDVYPYPAGITALALYTLLKCDVPPTDRSIQEGFAWLEVRHAVGDLDGLPNFNGRGISYREPSSSYEISAVLLALTAKHIPEKRSADAAKKPLKGMDKADRAWAEALVKALIARRGVGVGAPAAAGSARGWRYNTNVVTTPAGAAGPEQSSIAIVPPPGNEDLSSTQLAALALFAASRLGLEVPAAVWTDVAAFTLDNQEETGPEHERYAPPSERDRYVQVKDHARGFSYFRGSNKPIEGRASGAMTACGVANLLMARDALARVQPEKKGSVPPKVDPRTETGINDGLAWLDRNWSSFRNIPNPGGHYDVYYLYALERAMDLLGHELLGPHAWYVEGAEALLARQRLKRVKDVRGDGLKEIDGVWWETGTSHIPYDVLDTCFALLFLKRSTRSLGGAITPGG